jgi:hypothetical protein
MRNLPELAPEMVEDWLKREREAQEEPVQIQIPAYNPYDYWYPLPKQEDEPEDEAGNKVIIIQL